MINNKILSATNIVRVILATFLVFVFSRSEAYARTINTTITFSAPKIEDVSGFQKVTMDSCTSIGIPGMPELPKRQLKILLPYGESLQNIKIVTGEKIAIPGFFRVEPVQEPHPIESLPTYNPTPPNTSVYESANPYPGELLTNKLIQGYRGYSILILDLNPVEYLPSIGQLSYYKSLTVEVYTAALGGRNALVASPIFNMYRCIKEDNDEVVKKVNNADMLSTYFVGGIRAVRSNVISSEEHKYVIITNQVLKDYAGPYNWQDLLNTKNARDISTAIVTTEWIYANYDGTRPDGGSDNQTKIRKFIKDAFNSWKTEYVLLGGDANGPGSNSSGNIVPVRGLYCNVGQYVDYNIISDMYYACLTGDFDEDKDGIYGEDPSHNAHGIDEADFIAEVYVGRAPVKTSEELSNFVRKTIEYENSTLPYLHTAYMIGEDMRYNTWGSAYKDEIRFGSSNNGLTTIGFDGSSFFNVSTYYDSPTYTWNKQGLMTLINNGINVINHMGHAGNTNVLKMFNSDVDALTNSNYFFGYSQGCYCGAFDNRDAGNHYINSDSIVEKFVTSAHGAFAFIANSRYGWFAAESTDGPSQYFDRQFWDAVFGENILNIGKANQDSKEDNITNITASPCTRWAAYELNLLGDPEISLHVGNTIIPDLRISSQNIRVSNPASKEGDILTISTDLYNIGHADATNVNVSFYDGNPDEDGDNIPDVTSTTRKIGETVIANVPYQAENNTISRTNIAGTSDTTSGYQGWNFNGAPGLSNGAYIVKQKEIICTINYGITFNSNPTLTVSSTGWSGNKPNNGSNWCEIVNQSTTGCVLKTYVYHVWRISFVNHHQVLIDLGWHPTENATFSYTASGTTGGNYATTQINWDTTSKAGQHNIYVWADPNNEITELTETNNLSFAGIEVEAKLPPETPYFLSTDPTSGIANTAYNYSVASRDPNGDSIKFEFTWADGSMSSTTYGNYGANGYVTLSSTHTWTQEGIFGIQVRAIDTDGMESEWSAPWSMMIKQKPGWGSDFPLSPITTEPPLPSYTLISKFPDISSDNSGNIYTVWFGQYDTNGAIYYRKLINEGREANNAFVLSNVTRNNDHFPVIESDKANKLQLLWNDLRTTGNWEIYRLGSTDAGNSWTYPDENFSNNSGDSQVPQTAINGQNIHAVWAEGNKIYYKKSTDGGATWSNPRVIITTLFFNVNSRLNLVCDSTSNVFLVWAGQMPNVAWAIKSAYFSYSKNNGDTWQQTQPIYYDTGYAGFELNPDITVDLSGNIHIVYETKSNQLFYRTGTWSGGNIVLSSPYTIENNYAQYPNISIDKSNNLHLFWQDTRNGNYEIYYKSKQTANTVWGQDTRITTASGSSLYPKSAISNSYAHVVWQDNRNGNYQVYYNRMRLRSAPWVTNVSAPDFDVPPYDEAMPPYIDGTPNQTSISFNILDDTYNQQKISVWIYKWDGSAVIKKLVTDQVVTLDSTPNTSWAFSKYFQDFIIWDGSDEDGNIVPVGTTGYVRITTRAIGDPAIDPSDGLPGLIGTNWANIDTTDKDYSFADPTFVQPNRKNIKAWEEFLHK